MPNKARRYHYAESLGTSTSTVTTDTTKVTLTFTPDASSTYVYLWNCDVAGSTVSYDTRVSLNNNAGTVLCASNWETKDVTADWSTLSGMAFETFGASPTSQSITLRFSSEIATSHTASIRNARIIAIKLTSADVYAENTTEQTTTLISEVNALTITINPATSGNYLILGSCETRSTAVGTGIITQIVYAPGIDNKAYSSSVSAVNDTTNFNSILMQGNIGTLSSSKSVALRFYSGSNGISVSCRRARLLALRLDEFSTADIVGNNSDTPESTTTTSLTYVTKKTSTVAVTPGLSYLVIGSAATSGGSTTISAGHGLSVDGTYVVESLKEAAVSNILAPGMFTGFTVKSPTTSSMTVNLDYKAETGAVSAGMSYPTISVLMLDPTDLYWVGGGGTWDATTNTDWAVSSGGTGGAAAPKAATNVYFDGNSDSAAPFTVTVGTGAVCKNLTASGLDQTMTLSGTAAMSVYGNFSVPATNFTQSYTGTITFAGTGSQTITSNGKSFTSFVFDGVGGTWTLQDAATTSGASTLSNGTLALSSYTFTCSKFASNGSTTRSINFGNGKIVLTSALTEAVWSTSSVTGLTTSGTQLVQLTGGGATTKSISTGALSEANSISFQLSTTAGTVTFTASDIVRDLIIDNNSFTLANIAITLYGNLTIAGTTPTLTAGINAMTFAGTTGTQTITTNGKTLDFPITFSGTGTYALGSALSVGTTTSRIVAFVSGTLELNSYTLTIYGVFSSSYASARRIQMSGTGGKIVISLDTTTTVWTAATSTNFTTDGNVIVQTTGGGATTKTINTGALSEANAISFQISNTAGTVTFSANSTFKNITIDNTSVTISSATITIYGDVLVNGTTPTLAAGAGTWTFAATSGTKTINLNGNGSNTLDFPITFNGVGGTWQLQHALNVGTSTSRTVTLTAGTLDLNSYTVTIYGAVSSSGAGVRTLAFGSTGKIVFTLGGLTVWNSSTATNFSVTGADPLIQLTGGDVATAATFTFGAHTETNSISVQLRPIITSTVTLSGSIRNLIIDNYNVTLSNSTRTIYGNFIVGGTAPVLAAGASGTTFAATSGTKVINLNGNASNSLDFPVTFNGAGGTWQLQHDLTVGVSAFRTITLTAGTFDLNNYNVTLFGNFASSNSNTRTIAFGTGKIVITTNGSLATTIWNTNTAANLSVTGTPLVEITGSGTLVRTIDTGASTENGSISFSLLASGGTISLNTTSVFRNLTVNSTPSTTINLNSQTLYGSYTYTAGTIGTIGTFTFAATSGTKTISSGSSTSFTDITINGPGGTFELANNITMTGTLTLTAGTFSAITYNISASDFVSNNANVRALNMGSGTWTLSAATFWNITNGTNLTLNKQTANIVASYASTASVNFYGGSKSYNNLTYTATGTGVGIATISGSNTFDTVTFSNLGRDLYLESGATNSFNNIVMPADGTNQSVLRSITAGSVTYVNYTGTSKIRLDYLSLVRDIYATPVNTWYMGGNSTDSGNNTNVYFSSPPLYWIGGSGTWSSSATTNWSYFSGGSSAGYAPDFATDVIFDENSDTGTSFTVTVSTGAVCQTFNALTINQPMTLSGSAALSVYGSFYVPATNFTQNYTGTITFTNVAGDTGTRIITTNGKTFTAFTLDGTAAWALYSALTLSGALTLTNGNLDLGMGYNVTCQTFTAGAGADSITTQLGGSSYFYITSSSTATVWDISAATGISLFNGNLNVQLTGGGSTTKTINNGAIAAISRYVNFEINTTAGTVTFTASNQIRDLIIANNSFTLSNVALSVYGSLTISGTNPTLTAGTGAMTFANPVGTATITTAGKNLDFPITFNGAGTFSLQDALSIGTATARTVSLTAGTLELNSYTITIYGQFASSGSGVRRIQMSGTGGKFVLTTDTAVTVWSTATSTNMTTDGNINVQLTGGGATVKTVNTGTLSETDAISFQFSTTAGTVSLGQGTFKNFTVDNNSFTLQGNVTGNIFTVYGNLLISGTNPTLTGQTGALTFATSGTQTITTNGATIDRPITFSGAGTYTLNDALTIGATRATLYSSGNLNLNGYTFTVGTFEASGTSSRTIYHGSNGTIAVTGSGATAFNANGSNITANGVGTINMTSASTKRFVANGNSFSILNQGGVGTLEILTKADTTGGGIGNANFYSIRSTAASNSTILFQQDSDLQPAKYYFTNFEASGANNNCVLTIGAFTPPTFPTIVDGFALAILYYNNSNISNLQYVKIQNGYLKVTPDNKVFVRNYTQEDGYNYPTFVGIDTVAPSSNPGAGWTFVKENGFLSSFM